MLSSTASCHKRYAKAAWGLRVGCVKGASIQRTVFSTEKKVIFKYLIFVINDVRGLCGGCAEAVQRLLGHYAILYSI